MIPKLSDLPAKPKRIVLHWTGGGPSASAYEREHYHYLIERDGDVIVGRPVAQNMCKVGTAPYAAHTRGLNSYSVGVSFCGMAGVPSLHAWKAGTHGPAPLTASQVEAGCHFIGQLCKAWGIEVSADTVFTHAEAQRIHGVKQDGKWDIDVLEFRPNDTPRQIGDWLRAKIRAAAK